MSELVNARGNRVNFRFQLLATVSAIALIGFVYETDTAKAADTDSDHPLVWIELGGQLSRLDDGQEAFSPPLMDVRPSIFSPSQKFERLPLYSIDETGKISFEPDGSDWVLSASIIYGRSGSDKHVYQQTNPKTNFFHYTNPNFGVRSTISQFPGAARFASTSAQNGERHLIADFQAGKDVGLGMFGGKDGSSVLNLGVRFAQFSSKSNIALKSDPDFHRLYKYVNAPSFGVTNEKFVTGSSYHNHAAGIRAARSFHGIGPSLSWNASAPLMGNPQGSELALDWGLNAAILFGRQRALVHHQTTAQYHPARYGHYPFRYTVGTPINTNHARSRAVTVPNIGGFAGASWRIQNFKVSAGYRADFFFGAMDGGIDAAKKENTGFYGPFAAVSIGIGG